VEDIRNLIDQVRFAPQLGQYKVYIIDEVHMLSTQAFNAFLKTLEEPPKHAIFILATTEKHKIIPTILSRCQIFDFQRIQVEDIASHLAFIAKSEGVDAETDGLHVIAQKADGALRDACSIFDQIVSFAGNKVTYQDVIDNLNILDYDYYFKATDAILEGKLSETLLIYNDILNKGFDGHHFVSGLASHFRNLMVCMDGATLQLLEVSAGVKEKYKLQSAKCPLPFLMRALDTLSKTDMGYKGAKNPRLLVELSLMQLAAMNNPNITGAEKKNDNPSVRKEIDTISVITEKKKEVPPVTVVPPAVKQVSAVSTPSTSSASSTSLRNLLKKETPAEEVKEIIPEGPVLKGEVTQESLEAAWKQYAEIAKGKNKINLSTTLTNRTPLLGKDWVIEFSIDNKVQEEELNTERLDLLGFLRKELSNTLLQLSVTITRIESEKRPYTGNDKFKRMAEKNPSILALKQGLDLDIEL
jgi:DNA polymerase III subunit gamma/tau